MAASSEKSGKVPPNFAGSSPEQRAEWTFGQFLSALFAFGARPDGSPTTPCEAWTPETFATALTKAATGAAAGKGLEPKKIRNWLNDDNCPDDIALVENVMFGDNPSFDAVKLELRAARTRSSRRRRSSETALAPVVPARSPHSLPYVSLGALFKGRDEALAQIAAALASGGAAAVTGRAVHGLGGVGKTRLAVEYGWRHLGEHSAVLFLPADTPEKLAAGLAAQAAILGLPEARAREDEVKAEAVRRWLAAHPGWLAIFDNVDDATAARAAQDELARLSGGKALITARWSVFPAALKTLPLGALDEDAATAFLLEATESRPQTPEDETLARRLAREMDGLALALEQAAAYIRVEGCGLSRYLDLWSARRETLLGFADPAAVTYKHDVTLATTWDTSIDTLEDLARFLLGMIAHLDPAPIPLLLIDALPAPEGVDPAAAFRALRARSLLQSAGPDSFTAHRLLQDHVRRRLGDQAGEALEAALGWVNAAFEGDPQDVRAWPRLAPLAPHAAAVTTAADAAGLAEPTAQLMNNLAQLYDAQARLAEAEPLMRRALAINEASVGLDHANVASCLSNLAGLLQATNRLAEAEPLMRRALAIDEASFGPEHPEVALDLNNLAQLLQETNRLAEAEPLLRRALAIGEASFGPEHPNVAVGLSNLASLLQATNRLAEAEPLLRRALAIDEASHGPEHPNVAVGLSNLASLLQATNRLAEAEPLMRRALAIDEASLGPQHPNVAIRLNNLAHLLQATNRLAEAEPLIRRALAIWEAALGAEHPNVAVACNHLAQLLQATNRLAEAEPLLRRALAIDEASLGPEHPKVAIRLNNLAHLLQATNRLAEAEPLMRRALAILLASSAAAGRALPNLAPAAINYFTILLAAGAAPDAAGAQILALAAEHGVDPAWLDLDPPSAPAA